MMIGYVLLALGIAIFVLSFVIPAKTEEEKEIEFSEDLIRQMVGSEVESAKKQIMDVVDETVSYAMEKTERSMDRLTNEKIMAVNEYSDTVLAQINKNQQEVVFLYDMLNDKHDTLMNTVNEVDKKATEVQRAVQDAQITAMETQNRVEVASKRATGFEPFNVGRLEKIIPPSDENYGQESGTDIKENNEENIEKNIGKNIGKNVERNIEKNIGKNKEENTEKNIEENINEDIAVNSERMRALARLKAASNADEVGSLNDSVDFTGTLTEEGDIGKTSRKKKTSKTRIHQENEETAASKKDAPSLNLGVDSVGKPMGGRNNNEIILELHNKGKSNMAIAKELGLGIGEVKLVIDLFEGM